MKKQFNYLVTLLIIAQVFNSNMIRAQEKEKIIIQLNPGLSIPVGEASNNLNIGAGAAGSIHFSLSKSVKLGADMSYQANRGKEAFQNFNVTKLAVDVMWFPVPLFKRILKNKEDTTVADNLYIGLGFGPSLVSIVKDRVFLGTTQYIGYLIPLKNENAINIKLSSPGYIIKNQPPDNSSSIYRFVNVSLGYTFR
ncbi:MAG: hypothetical protein WBP45_15360 [Daejeonella sp.]